MCVQVDGNNYHAIQRQAWFARAKTKEHKTDGERAKPSTNAMGSPNLAQDKPSLQTPVPATNRELGDRQKAVPPYLVEAGWRSHHHTSGARKTHVIGER